MYTIECRNCHKEVEVYDRRKGRGSFFCRCGAPLFYKDARYEEE